MEIIKKTGINKIKIRYNKGLFWCILALITMLLVVVYFCAKQNSNNDNECNTNNDCVANSCCHATACVSKENAPICDKIMCSQECLGPLDCNAGSCSCDNGECKVIPNK